ncbi:ALB32 protein, partial [Haematococcus lacustris]
MMLSSVRASGLRLRSSEGSGRKRTPGCSSARRPTVAVRAMLELDQSAAAASTLWTVTHHVNQLASVAEDALLDSLLVKANVPYSYGFAIILLTVLVKLATFPLSQKQVRGHTLRWCWGRGCGAGRGSEAGANIMESQDSDNGYKGQSRCDQRQPGK